jgi:glycosyltransferase involved in cell wall biosynthesis
MKHDLIIFGEDWGGHPSSTQHLARRLACDRRVLWVNSLGLRRPRLSTVDAGRLARKGVALLRNRRSGEASNPRSIGVISPAAIPWPGNAAVQAFNGMLLARQIGPHVAAMGGRPLFWTSLPTAYPAVDKIAHGPVVYYCGDDFASLAGVDHAPVTRLERALVDRADLIVAASETLAEKFPARKTCLLPHGVDLVQFQAPMPRPDDLPDGPVAGFYGNLADWIDIEALAAAATMLPNWTFVCVGPVTTDVSRLARLSNVRLLGARPHSALPGYLQHWQVSLLPFRDCPQIRACNPLKLREYLAAGTPIASTSFPALAPYRHLVVEVEPACSLSSAILAAANDTGRNALRRASVAGESWESRAQTLSERLETL